jgi:hypothetical protein
LMKHQRAVPALEPLKEGERFGRRADPSNLNLIDDFSHCQP